MAGAQKISLNNSMRLVFDFMCPLDQVMVPKYLAKYESRCHWEGHSYMRFTFKWVDVEQRDDPLNVGGPHAIS